METAMLIACVTLFAQQISGSAHQNLWISPFCPRHNDLVFLGSSESYLQVSKSPPPTRTRHVSLSCRGSLAVPKGKFISMRMRHFETDGPCKQAVFNLHFDDNIRVIPCDNDLTFHSGSNKIMYHFMFFDDTLPFRTTITVTASDENRREHLNATYQTNFSGTVIPYGFDGFNDYAVDLFARAWLFPPAGHSVMVSFPHVDLESGGHCRSSALILHVNGAWQWSRCGPYQMPPAVYQGNVTFYFRTEPHSRDHSGFKVRFSFHSASERPTKLHTTKQGIAVFNCSVSFFDKFRQHLDCNLGKECALAEDETSCPYSHGACEQGFLSAGNKCYKYVQVNDKFITWYDAAAECLKQGLSLASFPAHVQATEFRENILHFAFPSIGIYVGLRTSDPSLPAMYREVWQWSSGIMSYEVRLKRSVVFKPSCIAFSWFEWEININVCGEPLFILYFFCEAESSMMSNRSHEINLPQAKEKAAFGVMESARFVRCSEGHVTHDFLSCDQLSRCGTERGVPSCTTYGLFRKRRVEAPMFVCDSQTQTIHYTQVCDHQPQCFDSSDETFCIHKACSEKQCQNLQCISVDEICDGMSHCLDGSDEVCPQFVTASTSSRSTELMTIFFDGHGKYSSTSLGGESQVCPLTHFMCIYHDLCLPVYLRCNGIYDCAGKEDESKCDDFTCPGYYRCRWSSVCVHSDHVCDGVPQCPQRDDELLCELVCPGDCLCQGLAFVCPRPFPAQHYPDLRLLDASGSGLSPNRLFHNHYLISLSMSNCGLYTLPVLDFPNIRYLSIGRNNLTNISVQVLLKLSNLNFLNLSGNPISYVFAAETNTVLENVQVLDLSYTQLRYFESSQFRNIPDMKGLNLSYSVLKVIKSSGFGVLTQIESLDLRGTELEEYPVKMLQSLSSLRVLFSDVYKLCCSEILPNHFNPQNCHTSPDEISSCKDLLRSMIYRIFLWISTFFALVGNVGSLAARLYMQRRKPLRTVNIFIGNLNVADFFMGMYLVMVGSADQIYRGTYLWHDKWWKTSLSCQIAGFFSLLSCEMSAFITFIITIDRFLVVRFPLSQLRFRSVPAGVVCGLSWVVGIALAAVPLFPMTSHWEFYSQTDICIPLPITRQDFKGRFYSFGILIVLNFIIFVLIAIGQLFIYLSIRDNSMATDQKNEREAAVARRLLTVVMSDFLCWFPIGLLGLLASSDVPIPGEVNVAMAIFALPLNSALNPFLYSFNLVIEKRRKAFEQRLLKILKKRISS